MVQLSLHQALYNPPSFYLNLVLAVLNLSRERRNIYIYMYFLSSLNIDMMLIVVTGNPSSRKIRSRLYATAMPHGYVALATVNAIWLLMAWRRQGDRAPSQYKDRLIYVWRFPC